MMNASERLRQLEGGIRSVDSAQALCDALHLELREEVIVEWEDADDARDSYGLIEMQDQPGSGVDMLELSCDLCRQLQIDPPSRLYTRCGRAVQARMNALAILQELTHRRSHP